MDKELGKSINIAEKKYYCLAPTLFYTIAFGR